MKGSSVIEIINAISKIATQYGGDGAYDGEGERVDIGLKRDQGHIINDTRVIDGFSVGFQGNILIINYQSEVSLKDVHDSNFENETEQMINKVATFLRKEYKKEEGKALTLTAIPNTFKAIVQSTSRVRSWVQATKLFNVGGLNDADNSLRKDSDGNKLDASIRNWLELGKKQTRPENEEIKPKDNEAPKPYKKDNKNK